MIVIKIFFHMCLSIYDFNLFARVKKLINTVHTTGVRKIEVLLYIQRTKNTIYIYMNLNVPWFFSLQNSGYAANEVPDDKALIGFAQISITD